MLLCSLTLSVTPSQAPCDPENVASLLQCSSGVVTVSWEASAGATGYTASAQEDGETHFTSCSTTGTSCDLTQLECGEVYTVTVVARDGICNSTLLATTTIKTGKGGRKIVCEMESVTDINIEMTIEPKRDRLDKVCISVIYNLI